MKKFDRIMGQRIYLEALNPKTISSDYVQWMQDEEVLRFLTGRTKPYSLAELGTYVTQMNDSLSNYLFGIFLKENNVHIGNIKIGSIDAVHRFADVGLLIGNKAMWGKGYASEAISFVTAYGFKELDINKLTAGMVVDNVGSYKAFLKAGYREVGRLTRHVLLNGFFVDSIIVEKCR